MVRRSGGTAATRLRRQTSLSSLASTFVFSGSASITAWLLWQAKQRSGRASITAPRSADTTFFMRPDPNRGARGLFRGPAPHRGAWKHITEVRGACSEGPPKTTSTCEGPPRRSRPTRDARTCLEPEHPDALQWPRHKAHSETGSRRPGTLEAIALRRTTATAERRAFPTGAPRGSQGGHRTRRRRRRARPPQAPCRRGYRGLGGSARSSATRSLNESQWSNMRAPMRRKVSWWRPQSPTVASRMRCRPRWSYRCSAFSPVMRTPARQQWHLAQHD